MSEKDQQDSSPGTPPAERPDAAEEKRLEARRRFVSRGAAGSGAVVLTLYHSKGAVAKAKKVNLSSAEACQSLGGVPGKTVKVKDSVTGKKVDKIECEIP